MIFDALNTARDLGRLHEIASVLVRHGFGDTVHRLGLAGLLERVGRAVHWKGAEGLSQEKTPEVRVREALEQLGPTFIKLGQLLSGRQDLLPPDWTKELARLQEHATPLPYDELREQLVEDLGAPPEEVFAEFETTPIAAASIAQVHRARLEDGTRVVLKIRRPGIEEVVDADLRLMGRLAERAEHVEDLKRYRPKSLVRQFGRSLRSELDLRSEARNAERLRRGLEGDGITVPRIYAEWTRERLCVMDFLEGPSVGQWVRDGRPDVTDPKRVADTGADAVLRTVFEDGFFHADPHPGNVLLLADGSLGLIDYGMVGHLSESRRIEFLELLLAVAGRNVDEAVDILIGWSDSEIDVDRLTQDCIAFLDRHYGLTIRELDTTAMLTDLMSILRENDLFLPNDAALLLKMFVSLEGLGRMLDPEFSVAEHMEPFARKAWRARRSPIALARRATREAAFLLSRLPQDIRRLMTRARQGRIQIAVDMERLDGFGHQIERSANRVTVGLVTAALIVGTSIALTVEAGPHVFGLPVFGFVGFTSSAVVGVWLLWAILRSGRG